MIAGVVSFIMSFASRQPKHRLLPAIAVLLVGAAAHAQEEAVGRQFLPLPEGIPAMLFDGLSEPEDPTEIAHQVRRSISDPAATSASTDSSFDRTIEPAALTAPDFTTTAALPGALEDGAVPTVAATTSVISVIVENVETSGGTVNIGLCDKGLSRETCPYDKSGPGLGRIRRSDVRKYPAGQLRGGRLS